MVAQGHSRPAALRPGEHFAVPPVLLPGMESGRETPVDPSEKGLIRVKAPAGEYELRLRLDGGPMESGGKWVSALSVLVLICWAGIQFNP